MILEQTRRWKGPTALIGSLCVDGVTTGYLLENRALAIPLGSYKISLYNSPKHGPNTPLLNGVPGRSFIEIHPANWAHELLGCLAPGVEMGNDCVNHSVAAYEPLRAKIMAALASGEGVYIDVKQTM